MVANSPLLKQHHEARPCSAGRRRIAVPGAVWEPEGVRETLVPVVAHQGGWDEMLMVLVPIAIFAALLVIANRRAGNLAEQPPVGEAEDQAAGLDHERGRPPETSPDGGR